jgi:hypothetical protein
MRLNELHPKMLFFFAATQVKLTSSPKYNLHWLRSVPIVATTKHFCPKNKMGNLFLLLACRKYDRQRASADLKIGGNREMMGAAAAIGHFPL